MSPADAWQRSSMPAERPSVAGRAARFDRRDDEYGTRPPRRTPPPVRGRPVDRGQGVRRADPARAAGRPERGYAGHDAVERRGGPRPEQRGATARSQRGDLRAAEGRGGRLRGAVAVGLIFVLTLIVGGAESFLGVGLGTITLAALVLTTVVAALLVRRRDLVSVIVAPPLIFVAVAIVDVAAAPSANLNLATLGTLLIRGFPAMGIATGLALVIGLIRMAARR